MTDNDPLRIILIALVVLSAISVALIAPVHIFRPMTPEAAHIEKMRNEYANLTAIADGQEYQRGK